MFCVRCQRDVYYCICPDIEERLKAISQHPNFAVEWCPSCDKAASRCDCPDVRPKEGNVILRTFGALVQWARSL